MSRVKNTTRNAIFASLKLLVQVLAQFGVRTAFIYTLGAQYIGLDSLFLNIVMVLSITELGIGVAIGYSMYKPAADGDIQKLKSLNALYRKVYRYLSIILLVLGLAMVPFLDLIIDTVPKNVDINIAFAAFLCTTMVSFLAAHKRTLLFVHQRNDILSKVATVGMILTKGIQVAALFMLRDYYIYLAVMPLGALAESLIILFVTRKLYPQITGKAAPIDADTKKAIVKNVAALSLHRISMVVLTTIGTIMISIYFGLEVLGLSANYVLIFSSVLLVVELFSVSVQSSVGNMIASDSAENNYKMFKMLNLGFYILVGVCAVLMLCLYQPFIVFWANGDWVLPFAFAISIVVRFYLSQIVQLVFVYRTCAGLMWNDRWVPIVTVPLSIGLAILFVHIFGASGGVLAGLPGIFFGIATATLVAVWVTPYILYKHYFKKSVRSHYLHFIIFTLITTGAASISYFVCSLLPFGFWFLALRAVICCGITGIIYLTAYGWTKEFKLFVSYAKRMLKRRIKQADAK